MESGNLPDCIEKGLSPGVNPVISMPLCEASARSFKNFLKKNGIGIVLFSLSSVIG